MSAQPILHIDLIRHGEPEGGPRYRGQSDDPLSERGWEQMWSALGEASLWDRVYSSPLQRCRAFAEALAGRHGLPLAVDERLMEIGFGAWEGRTAVEIDAEDPQQRQRYYADPLAHRPSGAEPLDAFRRRVAGALREILADHRDMPREQRILLVAHAGVIRAALAETLEASLYGMLRVHIPYAETTRLSWDGARLRLLRHAGGLD